MVCIRASPVAFVCLVAVVWGASSASGAAPHPVVIVPGSLHAGTTSHLGVFTAEEKVTAKLYNRSRDTGEIDTIVATAEVAAQVEPQMVALEVGDGMSGEFYVAVESESGEFYNETKVKISGEGFFLALELDKKVYKPGQTVRARVLALSPSFMAVPSQAVVIDAEDPNGFVVARWERVLDERGETEIELLTSSEPVLGRWKLKASTQGGAQTEEIFSLEEYVLPKFEVAVTTVQHTISPASTELAGTVSATYTYGEPVQGTLELTVIQEQYTYHYDWDWRSMPARDSSGTNHVTVATYSQPALDGTAQFSLNLENVNFYEGSFLMLEARVVEGATGEANNGSATVQVSQHDYIVKLSGAPSYLPNTTYSVAVQVTTHDDTMVNSVLKINSHLYTLGYGTGSNIEEEHEVNIVDGEGSLEILMAPDDSTCCNAEEDLVTWNSDSCCAVYMYLTAHHLEGAPKDSRINGYLYTSRKISSSSVFLDVKETGAEAGQLSFTATVTGEEDTSLNYVVVGRLGVLAVGTTVLSGASAEWQVVATGDMAPAATLVAWIITAGGEMVADSVEVSVMGHLGHDVNVAFSAAEKRPGEEVEVTATGAPGARVFVLAVDRSTALQAGGSSELTSEEVFDGSTVFSPTRHRECRGGYGKADLHMEYAGVFALSTASIPACSSGDDFAVMFDARVEDAQPEIMPTDGGVVDDKSEELPVRTAPSRTRTNFPESWLWQHLDLDEELGQGSLTVTAPDTITTWDLNAFGLAPAQGLGISNASELRVFKPFFVSPNVPQSLTRTEAATILVGVYNYLEEEMEVTVEMSMEGDAVEVISASSYAVTVQAGGSGSVEFAVRGVVAGTASLLVKGTSVGGAWSDAVRRALTVQSEGIEQTVVHNFIANDEESVVLSSAVPEDAVAGSSRAQLTVIGDLMGPSMANLEHLLAMPYGCGEQNMVTTAPNVFVLQYLTAVGRLDAEMQARAERNMLLGYQRELTYRHPDASFSAFGTNDESGSTWLTAFVLKTFAQASEFVYVDPAILQASATWLQQLQQADGSFQSVGSVIHVAMQGGAGSGVSLTAYVLVALLEAGTGVVEQGTIDKAVAYIQGSDTQQSTYTALISAYAMALACSRRGLACDESEAQLTYIESIAVTVGGLTHWQKAASSTPPPEANDETPLWWRSRAPSTDIEMTAYGLLAYNVGGKHADSFPVAKWIMEERNELGGFSSTQDTVVALQALAEYAADVYSTDVNMNVEITGPEGFHWSAEITSSNLNVLQVQDAPVGAEFNVSVSGTGAALVQLSVKYNVLEEIAPPVYSLQVVWRNITGTSSMIADACVQMYTSSEGEEDLGMVLAEVGLYSGYSASSANLEGLVVGKHNMVKRAETSADGRSVEVYLDHVSTTEMTCFTLAAERVTEVLDLQPAVSSVFPYYEPARRTTLTTNITENGEVAERLPSDVRVTRVNAITCDDARCSGFGSPVERPPPVSSPPPAGKSSSPPPPAGKSSSPPPPTWGSSSESAGSLLQATWEITLASLAVMVMSLVVR